MKTRFKSYFASGLLVLVPIAVTFWVSKGLINWFDTIIPLEKWFGKAVPGLGILVTFLLVLGVGFVSTNFFGKYIGGLFTELINRLPLVGTVYASLRQVMKSLFSGKKFGRPVLVEYPRRGIWSVGFVISEDPSIKVLQEPVLGVFIPTTPNPTSGFYFLVPKADVISLSMTSEEALKYIVSLGVVGEKSGN